MPEDIRNDFLDNVLVCGGSITSMLQGEKVNDYDLYLKDVNFLGKLCTHFLKESSLENEPVTVLDDSVRIGRSNGSGYLKVARELRGNKSYFPIIFSSNAITLTDDIQIITRFVGESEIIIKNFDFIHTNCSYDFKKDDLHLPNAALLSMMSRALEYNGSLFPIASLFRLRKFLKRGWRISAGQIIKIAFQISKLDLNDVETFREQVIGVDVLFMNEMIRVLEGDSSIVLDQDRLFKIVDEIFKEEGLHMLDELE